MLKIDGLSGADLTKPNFVSAVVDIGIPEPTKVGHGVATETISQGASSRFYLLSLDVTSLPLNTTQARWLRITTDADTVFPYNLTNAIPGTFSWTVTALPNIALSPGDAIPVSVVVGPVAAHHVRVLQSALVNNATKAPIIATGVILCENRSCGNQADINLAPNTPNQLWLLKVGDVGQFTGSVTLASDEKPSGDAVQLTIYSSGNWHKVAGVALIFLGTVVGWVLTAYLRNWLNRDQLLGPARTLQDRLIKLQQKLAAIRGTLDTGDLDNAIRDRLEDLQPGKLETPGGLPGKWPQLYTVTAVSKYQSYIQIIADWTETFSKIIDAIEKAIHLSSPGGATPNPDLEKAIRKFNELALGSISPDSATVSGNIAAILNDLTKTKGVAGPQGPMSAQSGNSAIELSAEISRLSIAGWTIVCLTTTIAGAYVLIFTDKASYFGSVSDYLVCLLWGLGIPTAAGSVQSGSSTVTTAFNIVRSTS
jgi:hypothetical protein